MSQADIPAANTERDREPWRLRCPNGHSGWRRAGDTYQCQTGIQYDHDCANFEELVDVKEVDA